MICDASYLDIQDLQSSQWKVLILKKLKCYLEINTSTQLSLFN